MRTRGKGKRKRCEEANPELPVPICMDSSSNGQASCIYREFKFIHTCTYVMVAGKESSRRTQTHIPQTFFIQLRRRKQRPDPLEPRLVDCVGFPDAREQAHENVLFPKPGPLVS